MAQAHPVEWEFARQHHQAMLRAACEVRHGYVFQIIGDAFCAAFATASDALDAAIEAQREPIDVQPAPIAEPPGENPAGLSNRELEVLRFLAAGLTNPQISEKLTLSTYTVQAHLRTIHSKLGVTPRVAAAHATGQFK